MEILNHIKRSRMEGKTIGSWTKSMRLAVFMMKYGMNIIKDSVEHAQRLNKLHYPVPRKTMITECSIPSYPLSRLQALPKNLKESSFSAEWIRWPISVDSSKVILYAHGGAFVIGSSTTHRGITYQLSKLSKCGVLAINYRLSPQFTYPTALYDMISAYFYLIDPPLGHKKHDPSDIILCGDSAGGNLALSSTIWLRDNSYPLPGALALLSPWMDLTHTMPSFDLNKSFDYLPDKSFDPKYIHGNRNHYYIPDNSYLTDQYVSPIFSKESKCLPPTLIQVGDAERLFDENLAFYLRFSKSPIKLEIYQDMMHVFQFLNRIEPVGLLAIERICNFIQSLEHKREAVYTVSNQETQLCEEDHDFKNIFEFGRQRLINDKLWTLEREIRYKRILSDT